MAVGRGYEKMTTMDLLGRLKPWCDLRCQIVFMLLVRTNLYPPGAWIEVGEKGWRDWLNQPLHVSKQERQLRPRASMYLTITLTIQKTNNIYVNNQMWANMPYMDRWRQTAQGSRHLLVAPGDVGMLSVAEMSGHIAFEHSFLRKRVGPFTRVQKEKSGGGQGSISWWRGFWNLWCNEIWLVFDLACLFFGLFSGWISCYIIFLRHHGLSGSETSWAYFGTSIKIQGPKWFHELPYASLRVTESFWKWISDQTSSNLTWCLSDDCTQSKNNLGIVPFFPGAMCDASWSSWTWHLPSYVAMAWVTFGFKQVESHPLGALPSGPCIILHHFTPSPYAGRTCKMRGWVPLLGSTHFTPQFLGAQIAEMEFPSGHRNGR